MLIQNNKYSAWYYSIVESAKIRPRCSEEYYEKHHIIPKSLEGTNESVNLIFVTAKEHYVLHRLLVKFLIGKERSKMVFAYWRLMNGHQKYRKKITSREYQICKTMLQKEMSVRHLGSKKTAKAKEKIRIKAIGRKHTENTKKILSKIRTGTSMIYKNPEERNRKISKALTGRSKTKEWINKINKNPAKIAKTAAKHKGMKRSEISRTKMSMAAKGRKPHNKGKKYYYNPITKEKILCFEKDVPGGFINGFLR
jgi:hypothetical protein